MSKHLRVVCRPGGGGFPEPPPARPIRTIEIRTFPRLNDQEVAALLGMPFSGYVS